MKISATIKNVGTNNTVTLSTEGNEKALVIPSKANGQGSAINGGELLLLALATCYCNDIYREAAKSNLFISSVTVKVDGEFGAAGEPAKKITYKVQIDSAATEEAINELIHQVDALAEVHNTLRKGIAVELVDSYII